MSLLRKVKICYNATKTLKHQNTLKTDNQQNNFGGILCFGALVAKKYFSEYTQVLEFEN